MPLTGFGVIITPQMDNQVACDKNRDFPFQERKLPVWYQSAFSTATGRQ